MDSPLATVRRPTYTGENRCWPCTLANLLVLAAACAALALVAPPVAVAVGLAGVAGVWLRGYVVPYTPRFAPELAARLPWNPFHEPGRRPGSLADAATDADVDTAAATDSAATDADDGEAVLASLIEAGVVAADDETLHLTDAFRRRWDEEVATLRNRDDDALADAALATTPAASEVEAIREGGRRYVVLSDGSGNPAAESWLRRPVAIAETAAARALADADVPVERRAVAAHALGMFVEECPACGGDVVERTAGGCCGPPPMTADGEPKQALVCETCSVHLHVFG